MAPSSLTIRLTDPQRFPPGTQVGLYHRHDVGAGIDPADEERIRRNAGVR
jgi:hypothetical protein